MCTETIALCESCGLHRHMHYHRCTAWLWSYRQIKWTFTTPLSSTPKPKNCPFLDGEVKTEILPGRCPNAACPGHKLNDALNLQAAADGTLDRRTDEQKIDAQRVKMGLKRRPGPVQAFREPLEVGRPHQNRVPVVIMDGRPDEGLGVVRGRGKRVEGMGMAEMETEGEGAMGVPSPGPAARVPVRRHRTFHGPMMRPH
ncbi:hypothetical protein HER10_EVM0012362 [Colletotrichum scovillei]|uniref:uncharacterized protein n=1 Tax=Colletotrichum scovillei TaxID=1209932 RepID=UPI0015C3E522|nr:uncharacterized protein HER10_EVM0012362 [Colletotrichum scovillei]KAF4784787.1 hypothetical protein HER10_EVM0012362 [Colletotrichum scovillei]